MHHARSSTHHQMSNDFHTFGLDGIALNRVTLSHAAELARNEVAAALRTQGHRPSIRRALGSLLVRFGRSLERPAVAASTPPPSVSADSVV
jgi:hypothetical protein